MTEPGAHATATPQADRLLAGLTGVFGVVQAVLAIYLLIEVLRQRTATGSGGYCSHPTVVEYIAVIGAFAYPFVLLQVVLVLVRYVAYRRPSIPVALLLTAPLAGVLLAVFAPCM